MNIGFYLLEVSGQDQRHKTILNSINELCTNRPYDNIVLFNSQFNAVDIDHKYYMLHISHAKYFDGLLFVFDLKSALLTKTFPAPKKQILFVEDNDWMKRADMPYVLWNSVYNNDDFELVTSNKDMKNLCTICWKPPIGSVFNFQSKDIETIIKTIGEKNNNA